MLPLASGTGNSGKLRHDQIFELSHHCLLLLFGLTEARVMAGHACPAQSSAPKGGLQEVRDGVEISLTNKHLTALTGEEKKGEEKREKAQYLPFEV